MNPGKRFTGSIKFWGIFSILVPSILILTLNIIIHFQSFNHTMHTLQKDLLDEKKQLIKSRVSHIVDFISYTRESLYKQAKDKCKEEAYEGIDIILTLKDKMDKRHLIEILTSFFSDKSKIPSYEEGRYFVHTIDGKNIFNFNDNPSLVSKEKSLFKKKKEGFIFLHPSQKKDLPPIICFVKLIPSLNWVVGYKLYMSSLEKRLKKQILQQLGMIRFTTPNSYVFVVSTNGTVLMHGTNPNLVGKNMWNATDIHGIKIIQEAYKVAMKSGSGFIKYCWTNPATGKISPKITFVDYLKDWKWIICCGIYLNEVHEKMEIIKKQFLSSLQRVTFYSIGITFLLLILFLMAFRLVTDRFNKEINKLIHLFQDTVRFNKPIVPSGLRYIEFRDLARNANSILMQKIEAQRKLEREKKSLEKSEQRLRSLLYDVLDSSNVGVFILDSNFKVVWINKAIEDFFKIKREEVLNKDKKKLVQEKIKYIFEDPESFSQKVLSSYENNTYIEQFECHVLPDDNRKERWLEHWSRPISTGLYKGGRVEHYTDITLKKQIEGALKESEEYLRITLRSINDGVIATDTKGIVVQMNPAAETLTGWKEEKARGKHISSLFEIKESTSGETIKSMVEEVLETGKFQYETEYVMLKAKNDIYYISCSASPLRDDTGNIRGVVFVFRDETEKMQIQKEQLKLKKLESIGILAGGIAHDFNNILVGIFGNLELIKAKLPSPHPVSCHIETAFLALEKAKNLTSQLLTFAKGGEPILEAVDVEAVIKNTVKFHLSGSNIKPHFQFSSDLWMIKADKSQLFQVIANLVINAKEAMPEGGSLYIYGENVLEPSLPSGKILSGHYVKITLRDEGCGIPEKYLDKIFDPYFSTKQMGSGLGLAITYSIVKKHRGNIWVESKPGEGTTFYILFPADIRYKKEEQRDSTSYEEKEKVSDKYILLMDDEEMIREVAAELIEVLGYKVETAKDGAEALEKYIENKKKGKPFDVVIVDLTIPGGMGGMETGERILSLDPEAKIIVTSGYSTDPIMARFRDYGFKGRLVKPFKLEELRQVLNSL